MTYLDKLTDEFGLPEEQINLIINSYWADVRDYLTNPDKSRGGIQLVGFGRLYLGTKSVKKNLLKLTDLYDNTNSEKKMENLKREIELFKSLNTQVDERKIKKEYVNVGFSDGAPRPEGEAVSKEEFDDYRRSN